MNWFVGWTATDTWNWTFLFGIMAGSTDAGEHRLSFYFGPVVVILAWG